LKTDGLETDQSDLMPDPPLFSIVGPNL